MSKPAISMVAMWLWFSVTLALLVTICAALLFFWIAELRARSERALAGKLLVASVISGIAMAIALGRSHSISAHLRYFILRLGLLVGPMIFTIGYTAAISKRFRKSMDGPLLMSLGALIGLLIFSAAFGE